ncbi:related to reverse transcriptase/ribonuclease H Fragment-Coprinopsis cinerea [Serendipita indica DSM 11827]|uniref:Related to reverse transcriptase/ribonuclease H-Coprinopsis cinerea n=1 Tax=Serendipita indica (strain DSM 11827) TaxID=1109443 RepID=G4TUN3_SERID|nr:related to reverse transcriptase/ribonuclease H Fragment-Coprinopsis cinerea [Serendipita indica DSM 11827]
MSLQWELNWFTGLDIPWPVMEAMNLSASKLVDWLLLYFTTAFGRSKSAQNLVLLNSCHLSTSDKEDQEWNDSLDKPTLINGLAMWTFLLAHHRDPVVWEAATHWWEIVKELQSFAPASCPWEADCILINDVRQASAPFTACIPDLSNKVFIQKALEDHHEQEKGKLDLIMEAKLEALLPKLMEKYKTNVRGPQFFWTSSNTPLMPAAEPSPQGKGSSNGPPTHNPPSARLLAFGMHTWCFICSATTHAHMSCTKSKQVNGRDILAFCNAANKWALPGNKWFCFAYNGGASELCNNSSCPKDWWEMVLGHFDLSEHHIPLLKYLQLGFSYHSSFEITHTVVFPNSSSALQNPDIVYNLIQIKLDMKHYIGPFPFSNIESILDQPFISYLLSLVEKSNGKMRPVINLSKPNSDGISLNSLTDTSLFSLNWGGFKEMVKSVVMAPPGSQGAIVNYKDAFQMLGIRQEEWWIGVVHFDQQAWIDQCLKFGGVISPFNFELVATAFADMFHHSFSHATLIYWVDNNMIRHIPVNASPPWRYSLDILDVVSLGNKLNIVFPPEKILDFGDTTRYIRFDWHWSLKQVSLPENKRLKYLDLVNLFLPPSEENAFRPVPSTSLNQLQSMVGKLKHAAAIYPLGCQKLHHLHNFKASMERLHSDHPHMHWNLHRAQLNEIVWWSQTLCIANFQCQLCTHPTPNSMVNLFSDASSSFGIGIVIDQEYDSFKLVANWKVANEGHRDIGWAEFAAVEITVFYLLSMPGIENSHFLLRLDNMGVVGAWGKRASCNTEQNEILGCIVSMLVDHCCFLTIEYIHMSANLADLPP